MCTDKQLAKKTSNIGATSFRSWWFTLQLYRLSPLAAIATSYLLVSFFLRLVLVISFGYNNDMVPVVLVPTFLIGLINDSIILCYLLAPMYLLLTFMPQRLYRSPAGRVIMAAITWIAFFSIAYLAVMQYHFFKEFNARFNLVAVDYLIYPHEVFINIYQSYHVVSTLLIVATYATAILCFFWKWIIPVSDQSLSMKHRVGSAIPILSPSEPS